MNSDYAYTTENLKNEIRTLTDERENLYRENTLIREDIIIQQEKCNNLNDSLSEISEKFKSTINIIESCFDDIKNFNVSLNNTNFDNVDAILSSRVNDIKGNIE